MRRDLGYLASRDLRLGGSLKLNLCDSELAITLWNNLHGEGGDDGLY